MNYKYVGEKLLLHVRFANATKRVTAFSKCKSGKSQLRRVQPNPCTFRKDEHQESNRVSSENSEQTVMNFSKNVDAEITVFQIRTPNS